MPDVMHFGQDLRSKTIWVTGGAGYLGSHIVSRLDGVCKKVLCIDQKDKAHAFVTKDRLRSTVPVNCDLGDVSCVRKLIDESIREHGVPHGIVHMSFASTAGKRLEEIDEASFNETMRASLTSSFVFCRDAAKRMSEIGGGSIVLFSSMYGIVSPDPSIYVNGMIPNPIDYGVSKAGLMQMSRYMSVHFGPMNIRFNCVTPGAFTNPTVQAGNPMFVNLQRAKIPLGRIGVASEIIGPAMFLLSDESSYMTGQSIVVDGGWTAW